MASVFKDAVHQELAAQPWWLRYKGSLLIVLSGLAWVLAELAQSQEIADLGWGTTVGIAATVAAFLLNRFTRDGVTPSQAQRLEQAGMQAHLSRPSVSGIVAESAPDYVGEHRAPDVEE